jgi:hypothetical protein
MGGASSDVRSKSAAHVRAKDFTRRAQRFSFRGSVLTLVIPARQRPSKQGLATPTKSSERTSVPGRLWVDRTE